LGFVSKKERPFDKGLPLGFNGNFMDFIAFKKDKPSNKSRTFAAQLLPR
jgi:hypothetical protein